MFQIILGVAVTNGDGNKHSSSSSKKVEQVSKNFSKVDKTKEIENNFDKINLGSNEGMSQQEAEKLFWNPNSTSESEMEGQKTTLASWSGGKLGVSVSLTINFNNGHAVSKSIHGLKSNNKISLDDFNKIQNGISEAELMQQLGEPSGKTYTNISGAQSSELSYIGKGDLGANASFLFTNGKLTNKAQTNLK